MQNNAPDLRELLRSINIVFDADKPERIAHFQPTSKSLLLFRSVLLVNDNDLNNRACLISAPYGTGKSLAHTYLLQTVENLKKSQPVLRPIAARVEKIDPQLGNWLTERASKDQRGVVIALQGYQQDLSAAIEDALRTSMSRLEMEKEFLQGKYSFETLRKAMNSIQRLAGEREKYDLDRIVIIWDEFGKHLENIIIRGETTHLYELQTLAEFASRSRGIPVTLSLLLHQSLMNYAGQIPQSIRSEWKKIEGRFNTVSYIDDSKEIYQLLSQVIASIRKVPAEGADRDISEIHQLGLFREFQPDELTDLLSLSHPFEPVAFYLLPKISSRIAQHERTLFTFLNETALDGVVGLPELYDYFSPSMSADTSLGGTYHQWLETESAISKVDGQAEVRILKSVCLLGLGMTGRRQRVPPALLEFSLNHLPGKSVNYRVCIDKLREKNLLLYRKNTDSFSIWHGTDLDIAGKLEEEKSHLRLDFDFIEFIRNLIEPVHYKAPEHNNKYKITRFMRGEYLSSSALERILSAGLSEVLRSDEQVQMYDDGRIFYILPQTEKDLRRAVNLLKSNEAKHSQVLFVLPKEQVGLYEIALEMRAYIAMQEIPELIENDPLIVPELQQLADDALDCLQRTLHTMVTPSESGASIYYKGKEQNIRNTAELRRFISEIFNKVFHKTPVFNNELINRRRPRRTLVNARKKLIFSILEQTGEPRLGLEGFTPNVSFFHTLLLHTGLYKAEEADTSRYYFVQPEELSDGALAEVWRQFKLLLTSPGEKNLEDFFNQLLKPPFGMRNGVLPILMAAAMRAFPGVTSIRHQRKGYLTDILPSDIEAIVARSSEYDSFVPELDKKRLDYLQKLITIFSPDGAVGKQESDLIRRAYDAIELWKTTLPKFALLSRRVSRETRGFQQIIQEIDDPLRLFFIKMPDKLLPNPQKIDFPLLYERIQCCKEELDSLADVYFESAAKSFLSAFRFPAHTDNPVIYAAREWVNFFDDSILEGIKEGRLRAFISRSQNPYEDDRALINSISSLFRGKNVQDWDDSDMIVFEKEIVDSVHRIEELILNHKLDHEVRVNEKLAELAASRIRGLRDQMISLVGEQKTNEKIEKIIGGIDGKHDRSTGKSA